MFPFGVYRSSNFTSLYVGEYKSTVVDLCFLFYLWNTNSFTLKGSFWKIKTLMRWLLRINLVCVKMKPGKHRGSKHRYGSLNVLYFWDPFLESCTGWCYKIRTVMIELSVTYGHFQINLWKFSKWARARFNRSGAPPWIAYK